jgi:hypothetical protein
VTRHRTAPHRTEVGALFTSAYGVWSLGRNSRARCDHGSIVDRFPSGGHLRCLFVLRFGSRLFPRSFSLAAAHSKPARIRGATAAARPTLHHSTPRRAKRVIPWTPRAISARSIRAWEIQGYLIRVIPRTPDPSTPARQTRGPPIPVQRQGPKTRELLTHAQGPAPTWCAPWENTAAARSRFTVARRARWAPATSALGSLRASGPEHAGARGTLRPVS